MGGILCCGAAALVLIAARFDSRIRKNTMLGPIPVGGLTREEAAAKLENWWRTESGREIRCVLTGVSRAAKFKAERLGLSPDVPASIAQLSLDDFIDSARQEVSQDERPVRYGIKFRVETPGPEFVKFLRAGGANRPARAFYRDGGIVRQPEISGAAVDEAEVPQAVANTLSENAGSVTLPMKQGPKKISDGDLARITDVVSSFTTRFPVRKKDRNTNIRIASGKIDGTVIPPGGRFNFNNVVGRRTIEAGFKEAPVFKNGKHDMGVGGGICQVSSTLYNACLFADLKIVERHNHSMPVPYLPVGRDATVDYGSLNLVVENSTPAPIAISADYKPGALTFRVLGKKDPGLKIRIESSDSSSWDPGVDKIDDPTLAAGREKVKDKGSKGRSIKTYRVVYRDGKEIAKEPLGRSYYKGGKRVVLVGTKPAAPAPFAMPGFGGSQTTAGH